jgi:hypothetical protein
MSSRNCNPPVYLIEILRFYSKGWFTYTHTRTHTHAHTHKHTHPHSPGYGIRSALDVKSATACDSTALVPSMIVTGKTRTRGLSMFVGRMSILSYRQHFSSAHQYPFPGHVPRLAHTHTHTHNTHTHTRLALACCQRFHHHRRSDASAAAPLCRRCAPMGRMARVIEPSQSLNRALKAPQ